MGNGSTMKISNTYELGPYGIRQLNENDLKMVFEWRNKDRIRNVMVSNKTIDWQDHLDWYDSHKMDSPYRYYIFSYKGRAIGYIGYNDFVAGVSCDPGMYIGEDEGIPITAGIAIFYMSTQYAFEKLGMEVVHSYVRDDNAKSVAGTELMKFTNVPEKDAVIQGVKFRWYETSKESWEKNRENLKRFVVSDSMMR